MDNYYVYILTHKETGIPLYVGKGKGKRMNYHLKFISTHDKPNKRINHYLFYKCKSIINSGGCISENKVSENLLEEKALEIETQLIEEIGLDNLCNFAPSGSLTIPPKGTKKYDDYVIKMSEAASNRWKDPIYKEKMILIRKRQGVDMCGANHPMYGKTHTDEIKKQLSISHTGKKKSKESIEKTRNKLIGREITWKDKIGNSNKISWKNKIDSGYIVPEETRNKISNSSTGKYDKILDSELRTKIINLYQLYGPNRIRQQLLLDGHDVSLYIIRRELKISGIYKKYRKNSKL